MWKLLAALGFLFGIKKKKNLALLNSEFSLSELNPVQSPRLECRRNVSGF